MPVVMIPAARAPKPVPFRDGYAAPKARLSELRPPRYRVVGAIERWQARDRSGGSGAGTLRFRVPRVPPAPYVFALFCDSCARGAAGSLIIDERLVLRVRR
jgi:hypothetical protein